MPAYTYEALDDAGKPRTGVVEAENAKAARSQLRTQGLVPLSVAALAASVQSAGASRWGRRLFGSTGLAVWTRQLAGLVGAGLPLERALTALADEADQPGQRDLVAHLRAEVNAGAPFAQALASAPREFDDVYRAVVAAGEQSGALGAVLERLADDLEERQALRSKLLGAALYPAIVSLIAFVIVIFLVTYVVPQVASVFTSNKRALPWLTTAMLGLSAFVHSWGWAVLLAALGGAVALGQALRGLCGVHEGDSTDERWRRFAGRIGESLPPERAAAVIPLLAAISQVTPGAGVPAPLRAALQDPSLFYEGFARALVEFLAAECAARPVLLILEDLHWGDASTVRLVDTALRELADRPLLVVALGRPEMREQFPDLWSKRSCQHIPLWGLGKRACERLIRQVLGPDLSPEVESRIIAQSGGNALYLEERGR